MASTTVTITLTGASQIVVPAAARRADVECWGGASGGYLNGGGGGAFARRNSIIVVPGQIIDLFVGSGGSALTKSGGDTWFGGRGVVLAKGGAGSSGGKAAWSVGDVVWSGADAQSSAGGESASPTASGTNSAAVGSDQGGGATSSSSPNGSAPGGGGFRDGGLGARGQIRITYYDDADGTYTARLTRHDLLTTATGSWIAPARLTDLYVECWSGGAGGDGSTGGAGGSFSAKNSLMVQPSSAHSFVIGQGGTGAVATRPGGITWFGSTNTVRAAQPTGSTPPDISASVGDVRYVGGSGSPSGGGGSANPRANGLGMWSVGSQGSFDEEGSGGAYTGTAAPKPGGGGPSSASYRGGAGQIRLTYAAPAEFMASMSGSLALSSYGAQYPVAREGSGSVTSSASQWIGQYNAGNQFEISQTMLAFDLSNLPAREILSAKLTLPVSESYGVNVIEARRHEWTESLDTFVPGTALATKPLMGTVTVNNNQTGTFSIDLSGVSAGGALRLVLASADQRNGVLPISDDTTLLISGQVKLVVEFGDPITPIATASGSAGISLSASGSAIVASPTASASGSASVAVSAEGQAAVVVPHCLASGAAAFGISASGQATVEAPEIDAKANVIFGLSVSGTASADTLSLTAAGIVAFTLSANGAAAIAVPTIEASGSQTLAMNVGGQASAISDGIAAKGVVALTITVQGTASAVIPTISASGAPLLAYAVIGRAAVAPEWLIATSGVVKLVLSATGFAEVVADYHQFINANRLLTVADNDRLITVAAEDRTINVAAEDRTLTVPAARSDGK